MQREEAARRAESAADPDDAALVASAARGDRSALAALYDRHAPVMTAVGARILGDRALAEDLLHDVFLEAWHQAAAFDPARGTARSWLVMRMRSRALDRRARVLRAVRVAAEAQRQGETREALTGALPPGADHERVRRGVAALPAELAGVIDLAYFEGLSASEIAAQVGIPIGTVKSRLARAVATLRERIRPERGAGS